MCQPPQDVPLSGEAIPLWNQFKSEAAKKLGVSDLKADTYNFSIGQDNAEYYNFNGVVHGKKFYVQVIKPLGGNTECSMAGYE